MPLTNKDQYINAISYLRETNHFGNITLFLQAGNSYAELVVLNDATGANVTPTETELDTAYVAWQAQDVERQTVQAIKEGAKAELSSIPNYATWTQSEVAEWLDTNVTDLASAKTALKALAKMLIALRNEVYPDLQGS